jgi:hypothetical protein
MTISTPMRPTRAAAQRRQPTISPRSGIESAVMKIGETKLVADASATGRKCSPAVNSKAELTTPRARTT